MSPEASAKGDRVRVYLSLIHPANPVRPEPVEGRSVSDITELALIKSAVNALRNLSGNECKQARIRTPFLTSMKLINLGYH